MKENRKEVQPRDCMVKMLSREIVLRLYGKIVEPSSYIEIVLFIVIHAMDGIQYAPIRVLGASSR